MSRARILVVDDDESVLKACVRILAEIDGAEIISQKLSRRAAELLAAQSFDLLISDVRMPDIDGVELLKIARKHNPALPVILITGFPTADMVKDSVQLGAAACLMKPVLPDELLAAVCSVLRIEQCGGPPTSPTE